LSLYSVIVDVPLLWSGVEYDNYQQCHRKQI
jgi:hypothetical protein